MYQLLGLQKKLKLDNRVTIFVGDNGSGKSTLLETIAMSLNLPLIGGFISERPGFEAARILQQYLHIEWQHQTSKGFFFRAEDFGDFINSVENERKRIDADLTELKGEVDDSSLSK
jgi:predicted ATPase